VTVLNASGTNGIATQNTALLTQAGFHTATPGSATATSTTTTTTIDYPPGMEAQAKTVAGYVPGAVPVVSATAQTITLILGSDGHQVHLPSTSSGHAPTSPTLAPTTSSPARSYGTTDCIN